MIVFGALHTCNITQRNDDLRTLARTLSGRIIVETAESSSMNGLAWDL
jgi:hypothetical protein